jgi:Uma2 family endonuclease
MGSDPTTGLLTSEDLWGLPDDGLRHELAAGRLLSEPPAGFDHGEVANELGRLLKEYAREQGLGRVVSGDVGFVLKKDPDTVRAPDVAFVRRERLQPGQRVRGFFPGAPDLAVEVLSPGDRPGAVAAKVTDYLNSGTRLVWIVDPDEQQVTAFAAGMQARVFRKEDDLEAEDLLPGFRVTVREIFR